MLGPIARYRSVIIFFVLAAVGVFLIGVSRTFHWVWGKVEIDNLIAEVGALILVVGILHWLFELGLRQEMVREVAGTVAGSTLLHDNGLGKSCSINSRQVDVLRTGLEQRISRLAINIPRDFLKIFMGF